MEDSDDATPAQCATGPLVHPCSEDGARPAPEIISHADFCARGQWAILLRGVCGDGFVAGEADGGAVADVAGAPLSGGQGDAHGAARMGGASTIHRALCCCSLSVNMPWHLARTQSAA